MQNDLISRQSLMAHFATSQALVNDRDVLYCNGVLDVIEQESAVDAVPVVRCRDCKHWSGRNDKPGEVTAIGYCNHPNHHIMPLRADWFCADGEKMDGGAENV